MEKLYNNIILPDNFAEKKSDALNVPYLRNPPEVIDVSIGRQLFVDDFLVEETELKQEYHKAKKLKLIRYFVLKNSGKLNNLPLLVLKVVVCGMMKMRRNLKCGMKGDGSEICVMQNLRTV